MKKYLSLCFMAMVSMMLGIFLAGCGNPYSKLSVKIEGEKTINLGITEKEDASTGVSTFDMETKEILVKVSGAKKGVSDQIIVNFDSNVADIKTEYQKNGVTKLTITAKSSGIGFVEITTREGNKRDTLKVVVETNLSYMLFNNNMSALKTGTVIDFNTQAKNYIDFHPLNLTTQTNVSVRFGKNYLNDFRDTVFVNGEEVPAVEIVNNKLIIREGAINSDIYDTRSVAYLPIIVESVDRPGIFAVKDKVNINKTEESIITYNIPVIELEESYNVSINSENDDKLINLYSAGWEGTEDKPYEIILSKSEGLQ